MPFPSTRVIHPRWAGHHRPTTTGTHTATCTIETAGAPGDWNPVSGPVPVAPDPLDLPLYAGACGVTARPVTANPADAAGQLVVEHPYLVALADVAVDIPIGARVTIDTCPDDPLLVGKVLTVAEIELGSFLLDRNLLCDLDMTNQPNDEA